MAVAGHQGGSYAQLDKTENYVGQALTNLGNVAFRDRQFKQEQADKVQAQKAAQAKSDLDARQKEIDDLDKLNKEHPLIKTGQDKIDNPNLRSAFEFKKVYADARANYLKTGNPDDVAKYQNALSSLDGLSKLPEMYNAFSADLTKGSAEGLYNTHSAEKKAKILDLFQKGNYTYSPDKNGNPLISVYDTDENGKVSDIVANQLTGEQILQKMKPIQSFNYNGESGQKGSQSFIENFKQSLGTEQEVYKNGKITKEFPNGEALAKKATDDLLKNDDQVYQMAILSGIEPRDKVSEYKPEELQLIKQKVEKDLIDRLPKSERPDYEAQRIALEREKEARRIKEKAKDDAKDDQSFTTTPEIPLNFNKAGVKQGKDLVMNIENGKAKPSLSFTNKNGGKVINFTNVIPQKVSRVLKDGKYVYVTEISHLKPTKIYAEGGEDLGGGAIAKKGDYLGVTDVQTSEVVTLREANALSLLKSKTIKTKEDLRNIFPKEQAQSTFVKKEISRADLASKAKASGYSAKEYEALLIKNGVTIK